MRGFHQTLQLAGRDERDVLVTAAIDDHDVPLFLDFFEEAREVLADIGVGRLAGHGTHLLNMYRSTVHIERSVVKATCFHRAPRVVGNRAECIEQENARATKAGPSRLRRSGGGSGNSCRPTRRTEWEKGWVSRS